MLQANSDSDGNDIRTSQVLYIGPGNGGWHTFEFRVSDAGNGNAGTRRGNFPFSIAPAGTFATPATETERDAV